MESPQGFRSSDYRRHLESLLKGAVKSGNVEGAAEYMDLLYEFYGGLIDEMDSFSGQVLGLQLFSGTDGISVYDALREDYLETVERYREGSRFYNGVISRTRRNSTESE